ncbi:hypothetical protein GOV09_02840 [Candidatus Woesearchaeota archaeon]|nr:hypothetical protein [Candidatus Woesearchaeota archaeon]
MGFVEIDRAEKRIGSKPETKRNMKMIVLGFLAFFLAFPLGRIEQVLGVLLFATGIILIMVPIIMQAKITKKYFD